MGKNSDILKSDVLLKKKRKILKSIEYFKIDSPASLSTSSGSIFLCERLITESCLNKHVGCELHWNPTAERKKYHLCYVVPHNMQQIGLMLNVFLTEQVDNKRLKRSLHKQEDKHLKIIWFLLLFVQEHSLTNVLFLPVFFLVGRTP